jgi:hypothetical protein
MAPLYKPKETQRLTESITLADLLMKTVFCSPPALALSIDFACIP